PVPKSADTIAAVNSERGDEIIPDVQILDCPVIAGGGAGDASEKCFTCRDDLDLPDSVRQTFPQGLDERFLARPVPKIVKLPLVVGQSRQPPLLRGRKNCPGNFVEAYVRVNGLDVNSDFVANCNGRQDYAPRM